MTIPPTTTGIAHIEVRKGAYADSVALLQVSRDVAATDGVQAAQVAMATPLNLDILETMGFEIPETSVDDMIISLRVDSRDQIASAIAAVDTALASTSRRPAGDREQTIVPRTTASAMIGSDTTLALVSVPGPHAAVEAMDALGLSKDVMIFSDNVPVEQEIAMKKIAEVRGLLVMGPDCGTALIGGVGFGFANTVRSGSLGLVAASGTGCQQLMCLFDHAGVGVSAALGVGGRDLTESVGGLATKQALRRLDEDPSTEFIVVVSKPPAKSVVDDILEFADGLSTPVEFAILGAGLPDLTATTESVLVRLGHPVPVWPSWGATAGGASKTFVAGLFGVATPGKKSKLAATAESFLSGLGHIVPAVSDWMAPAKGASDGFLRGLFAGGTLCDESMLIASESLGPIYSNIPVDPAYALDSRMSAKAHLMIDFGDDSLTVGRAHPMIDPTLRLEYLARTVADPETSVVLMDVVLGHGSEADPGASLAPAIRNAIDVARGSGRDLSVVVACVGTEADTQNLTRQATSLAASGAEVFLSNAQAARRAVALIGGAL